MIIPDYIFEALYGEFVSFLDSQGDGVFSRFATSRYVDVEENYKKSIFAQANNSLQIKGWAESDIGTGRIHARVSSAMFDKVIHSGSQEDNNLLDWRKVRAFKQRSKDTELESTLFNLYKNRVSNEVAYQQLLSSGLEYQTIAYLFFIKDSAQFLPIAQETFDFIIREKLHISGFKTSGNASWANYRSFLDIVRQTRRFLRTKDPSTDFLDAHSFLWILGRQREEWLKEADSNPTSAERKDLLDQEDVLEPSQEPRHFLQYWLREQVERDMHSARPLEHIGSNQYDKLKVKKGDTVWVVTISTSKRLQLVGRLRVDGIVSYDEALAKYDDEVFDKELHVIANPDKAEFMQAIDIDDLADDLRFSSKIPKLTRNEGSVDGRQLQSIRLLTSASVRLLETKWRFFDEETVADDAADAKAVQAILNSELGPLEKEQLILARRGQGRFRNSLSAIEKGCRLTGVSDTRFLTASHIKPWRECDRVEKVDGFNGLWLAPHIDRLFDRGWISFSDDGKILTESDDIRELLKTWGVNPDNSVGTFREEQRKYLRDHRERFGFS